jgi:hypothetical protein
MEMRWVHCGRGRFAEVDCRVGDLERKLVDVEERMGTPRDDPVITNQERADGCARQHRDQDDDLIDEWIAGAGYSGRRVLAVDRR